MKRRLRVLVLGALLLTGVLGSTVERHMIQASSGRAHSVHLADGDPGWPPIPKVPVG